MNNKVLETLEYSKVKHMLQPFLTSIAGQKEMERLQPTSDRHLMAKQLADTNDAVEIYRVKGGIILPQLVDITPHMKRLEMQAALSGTELAQVSKILQAAASIVNFFEELADSKELQLERLPELVAKIVTMPKLTQKIAIAIETDGRITDEASSELKQIRQKIRLTEQTIREKMQAYTRGKTADFLTETLITMRNERYVIPVKAEYRNKFGGVVHDQSQTGQTLYIEPQAVVDMNNRLRQAQVAQLHEEQRILLELSNLLRPEAAAILNNANILGRLDFINAKARLAYQLKASRPEISDKNYVNLRQARHPLIDAKKVVANDIVIGEDYQAIIITGPNTGGKTITIKTLALIQIMAQSGLFIPADEYSVVGVFDEIYADIGDEQSIEQSLSTFSSHMVNIIDIIKKTDESSLVIVDELGAGTDPQEGAALAVAILDAIGAKGSYVVATTHYPELKAYGFNRAKTINASMEFDVDSLQPTYRFMMGIPGQSNAFEISKRLGMSTAIINEAQALTKQDSQDLNEMIKDLVYQRKMATDYAVDLKQRLAKVTQEQSQLEDKLVKFEKTKEHTLGEAKKEANHIVAETRKKADKIITDLRKKQINAEHQIIKEHELIDAKGAINSLEQDTRIKKNRVLAREKRKHEFKENDDVLVKSYGQQGVLLRKHGDDAWEVQMGLLKMVVEVSDLEKQNLPKTTKNKITSRQRTTVKANSRQRISASLDLRGKRYETAMAEVDRYIDSAVLSNLGTIEIIHGKGTGALRKGVQELLRSHPRVKTYNYANANAGGDGATIVTLK
ncbi:endonuclease MutS2 [Periweissella beninensis]|uniref:Endonuclease MutS2 n=1 Tax=Periweissella beninensis TaxID=504936 RepID=A0ABT0VH30_9LACO|nr:endonuclease MutS2 [Periweissella beninensis]MBM7543464.1 DNA mismatch repair protein MutS2 [Periweissella beninensis]MCM2436448.1 endonuclease MutS2 [Periweissella beninensis]MCT4396820.1 endonuclease MutS2 [Periweissella beninensis]